MTVLFSPDREPAVIAPGAVHVPGWLDRRQQEYLLRAVAAWAAERPPTTPVLPGGGRMSVRTLTLGRRWHPYRYSDGGAEALPDWLVRAGSDAVRAAAGYDESLDVDHRPDAALVNFYGSGATMGLHQDRDESSADPVVSLSLGDECTFRFGTPGHRGPPYTDVRLLSGDLVVFGGPSRLAFHGVPKVFDGTAPAWCAEVLGGAPGRVNLTLRRTR